MTCSDNSVVEGSRLRLLRNEKRHPYETERLIIKFLSESLKEKEQRRREKKGNYGCNMKDRHI